MKYLFVGDLHGRWEMVEEALAKHDKEEHDKIIFMGDMFDSFDRTVADQFKTFNMVTDLVKDGIAECVWANHEWSYLDHRMKCSGFNKATYARRHEFEPIVRNLFKPYLYLEDTILVTHAGLTGLAFTKEDIKNLDAWSKDYESPFFAIGRARGGRAPIGGPLWCDFNMEFKPIPNLIQVFGHTHGAGIRNKEESYCIDCLDDGQRSGFPCHDMLTIEI